MRWSLFFLGITSLLLVASVTANVALFERTQQYYREVNATRLDPVGLREYPQTPEESETPNALRVVVFGDSRAAGWRLPETEDYDVINRGIASQTSVQVLQRFDAHIKPLSPDIILVQVGINDLKTIGLFPHRADDVIRNCQANITQIVQLSQETGAVVVLSTILPAGKVSLARQWVWSDDIDRAVVEVNDYLSTLAMAPNVVVFDGFSLIATLPEQTRLTYYKDELHFTQAGYDRLNGALMPQLQTIVQSLDKR